MGLFDKWTLSEADKRIISELVGDMRREVPPTLTVTRMEALSVNKTSRIIERTLKKIKTYQENEKMGYWKKVRFSNAFQWKLKDQGYSKEFVSLVTESLVVTLALKKNDPEKK